MYHPTTRVLAVLELLQAHGRMGGPELAGRLEVDLRTVRRYITMLQDLGIPVEGERGRHGGYRLRPGFKLPPLMLSDDEAVAIALGLLAARQLGLAVAAPAVEGALAKIERVLPPAVRGRVAAVQGTLVTDLAPAREAPESATVVALSAAAHEGRRVWLRYASARGEETEREVDPYGLVFLLNRWYLAGYCHLRGDRRAFRLDRVRRLEPREDAFDRPPDFDALAFMQEALATVPGTWRVEALLRTDLEAARERVPPHLATLEAAPGGVRLCCFTECLDTAARMLVGFNFPFVVCDPPELRDALRRLAAEVGAAAEAVG